MPAQARMADALLRTLGGKTVLLRIPAPAVPGDDTEQLGQATPLFTSVPLGPAAFRHVLSGKTPEGSAELLLSASAVERAVGSLAFNSAAVLFATAAGMEIAGSLYQIVSVASAEAFGTVYLYRLGLRAATYTTP